MMRFRATRVVMGVSPYAIFLKETTGTLKGTVGSVRGKALGDAWRRLTPDEKAVFVKKAKNHPGFPKRVRLPYQGGTFSKFVKANYDSVRSLPFKERLRVLAKKFKAAQQKKK